MPPAHINNFVCLKILTTALTYNAYKNGVRHDPCGTELETENSFGCKELTQTSKVINFLCINQSINQSIRFITEKKIKLHITCN